MYLKDRVQLKRFGGKHQPVRMRVFEPSCQEVVVAQRDVCTALAAEPGFKFCVNNNLVVIIS